MYMRISMELYALCGLVTLSTLGVLYVTYLLRKELSSMHGMVFSMAIAMGTGLFAGTLAGIYFQGSLFLSTVAGIAIGAGIGLLMGALFSMLAVLEGLLSGIMAGMMGAMLGEMVLPQHWDQTLILMYATALSVCALISIETYRILKKKVKWLQVYQHPAVMGMLLVFLCLLAFILGPFFPDADLHRHMPHH